MRKLWRFIQFQFHNGSIKRNRSRVTFVVEKPFQFHNGSIKSQQIIKMIVCQI